MHRSYIKSLEQTCEDKDRHADALDRRIGRRNRTLDNLRGELKRKSSEIHDLRGEIKRLKGSDDCEITGVKTAADRNRELLKAAVDLTAEDPPRSAIPPNHKCNQCGKEFPSGWIPGHNVMCPDCGSIAVVGIPVYRSIGI